MKITIITPCKNAENTIAEAIESVVFQKGDFDLEYIIIDGESTDNTLKIIKKYQQIINENPTLIKFNQLQMILLSENDLSMYDALVKGFKLATGDIISYLNADDIYLTNVFQTVKNLFKFYKNINWLTGYESLIDSKGHLIKSILPYKYDSNLIRYGFYGKYLRNIQQESTFWRKELMKYIDFDDLSKYIYAGDFYIWKQFSIYTKLHIIRAYIGAFRLRNGQLSENYDKYLKELNQIKCKNINLFLYLKALVYKILWELPDKGKILLNKEIIHII